MVDKDKKDIFDRIMSLGIFRPLEPFYKKNKEVLLYLFFGVMTTVVSFITAGIVKWIMLERGAGEAAVSNVSSVVSWICSVTFAYVTNRVWVFESSAKGAAAIAREGASFYGGRVFTLLVEMLIMYVGYARLGFGFWVTKIAANVIVIVLNYIISKLLVFRS